MSQVTSQQISKVRKFSAIARGVCSVLLAMFAAALVFFVLVVIRAPDNLGSGSTFISIGERTIRASSIGSPQAKIWAMLALAAGITIACLVTYLLRRIFVSLARGEIFNTGNVQHLRGIGLCILGAGFLGVIIPPVNAAVFGGSFTLDLFKILTPFAVAGIIYLASWIMQVGLGVSEEADELRRDADLVV